MKTADNRQVSAHGTARALAQQLGHEEVVKLLLESLDEEAAADEKLTSLSEEEILPMALEVEGAVGG
jgi:ferritin-like metal-binding protein YciE